MDSLVHHLKEVVKINRRILNQLNKDEANLEFMRKAFDERKVHTRKMDEIIANIDKDSFSEEESASLNALYDRFDRQSKKIQQALDYILEESKEQLNDAIKRNKAEKRYQVLEQFNYS